MAHCEDSRSGSRHSVRCRRSLNVATLCAALALASPTPAAIVGDYTGRMVTEFYSYEMYGGGDVVFRTNPGITGCEGGFWLSPSDPGFKQTVATLLSAFHTRASVRVWAHNDRIWTGSGSPVCKLDALGLF